mmetsp:Transcript_37159/g.148240  ORF Transcript_37159/g.148240 Transcript_37159/m.148240 type:complete len:339 (-) Transcript_37159:2670-3686(-)|eukprot:CAMPEP_0113955914 /NCGR_PEP_ID=MMETSP0011_2-20120614/1711_1 /TAXON_ID=101924 /ORGANISM="Rhodosorus marinus" /LENGTH=338 /DNA_ID=CAMNT_0000965883 /DNA_START=882 /DNA_END=1898 /DNA_ORIENTATION=- /assembly_acc=CAM_ASM_000156
MNSGLRRSSANLGKMLKKMQAYQYYKYGGPEEMVLKEIDVPVPQGEEVLVKVKASSFNSLDWRILRGEPWMVRMAFGWRKPAKPGLGADLAGTVVAVGEKVTQFKVDDHVFGTARFGSFAEYACTDQDRLLIKPQSISFEEAAALPVACGTAIRSAVHYANIQPGQKVLIIGACGGVGSYCTQLVKSLGAHVTAVCRTANVDMAKSLGADEVFDYTKEDVCKSGKVFDSVLDNGLFRSMFDYKAVMNPEGSNYVLIGGSGDRFLPALVQAPLASMFSKMKFRICNYEATQPELQKCLGSVESGKVKPAICKRYKFNEIPAAMAYAEKGHMQGKVVVNM